MGPGEVGPVEPDALGRETVAEGLVGGDGVVGAGNQADNDGQVVFRLGREAQAGANTLTVAEVAPFRVDLFMTIA